jgi:hypothetical protein
MKTLATPRPGSWTDAGYNKYWKNCVHLFPGLHVDENECKIRCQKDARGCNAVEYNRDPVNWSGGARCNLRKCSEEVIAANPHPANYWNAWKFSAERTGTWAHVGYNQYWRNCQHLWPNVLNLNEAQCRVACQQRKECNAIEYNHDPNNRGNEKCTMRKCNAGAVSHNGPRDWSTWKFTPTTYRRLLGMNM